MASLVRMAVRTHHQGSKPTVPKKVDLTNGHRSVDLQTYTKMAKDHTSQISGLRAANLQDPSTMKRPRLAASGEDSATEQSVPVEPTDGKAGDMLMI